MRERGVRAPFQSPGRGQRQRVHDARRDHRPRPPAQRRGAKKGGACQAIGRSRGGLTTKIHAIVDALGNPVAISLTPGQASDFSQAAPLLDAVEPQALIADKAYDGDALIDALKERDIVPVIPSKANRLIARDTDFALYRERNLVERFFNKLKGFRAIATRYDKLASTFLAAVYLVSAVIWLN
ncbi:IS5 family transposase [Azospirillum lipoferum]|uniref:IS5 family transposase n=1 Tax=Azospirillum lipoferum TaxID=193 RepID=UPI001FCB7C8D|nr:IS5 family transposase [Azospirillum lipoferum]